MSRRDIIVHSLPHAVAALEAARETGVGVRLVSAPGAAATLGAAAFRDMVAAAERLVPGTAEAAVLDCDDAPGLALNALRHGIKSVRIDVSAEVRRRLADIAAQCGAALDEESGAALDLLDAADPLAASRAWLAVSPTGRSSA